jgi:hypothetical protein
MWLQLGDGAGLAYQKRAQLTTLAADTYARRTARRRVQVGGGIRVGRPVRIANGTFAVAAALAIVLLLPPPAAAQTQTSLELIIDGATGVRVGIPVRMVGAPRKTTSGHNWRTSDSRLDIDTLRFQDRSLSSLYEALRNRRGRNITRGELDLKGFVLEGTESDGTYFHVLARAEHGEIRGLSIVYSSSAREEVSGIVTAMISSFEPFPAGTASASSPAGGPPQPGPSDANQAVAELQRQLADMKKREDELRRKGEEQQRLIAEERARFALEKQIREEVIKQIVSARRETETSPAEAKKPGMLAGKRVAFVVGVNTYAKLDAHSQLKAAVNDAVAVGNALRSLGFDVIEGRELTRSTFNSEWEKFVDRVESGGVAAFFFAGHGVQLSDGVNYLLPSDVPGPEVAQESRLRRESINFEDLRNELQEKNPVLSLFILDACRNNPYRGARARSLAQTRGLAKVAAKPGSFVMYSADVDQEALDRLPGEADTVNSVYTRSLVPLLRMGDLPLQDVAKGARAKVRELVSKVSHPQWPNYFDGLDGYECLVGPCSRSLQAMGPK